MTSPLTQLAVMVVKMTVANSHNSNSLLSLLNKVNIQLGIHILTDKDDNSLKRCNALKSRSFKNSKTKLRKTIYWNDADFRKIDQLHTICLGACFQILSPLVQGQNVLLFRPNSIMLAWYST